MSTVSPGDVRALRRDKYGNDPNADMAGDLARLARGEPLAYVIGWVPFLGLRVYVGEKVRALIPRPETEWWVERMIRILADTYGSSPFSFLDLCSGSGAIGLAVMKRLPNARVTFTDIEPAYVPLIARNIRENGLDAGRAHILTGDLFAAVADMRYGAIASNPPYIPEGRTLPESVSSFEPSRALFAGAGGMDIIKRIADEAPVHMAQGGMMWLECDTANADQAVAYIEEHGAVRAELSPDQYGRPRLVVAYYP